jgi:hypothetical protein
VPAFVNELRGRLGRYRVSPRDLVILVRVPSGESPRDDEANLPQFSAAAGERQMTLPGADEEWVTLFGGRLQEPFRFPSGDSDGARVEVSALDVGDVYPGPIEPATELRFRQRGGGTIAKKIRGGEVFAHGPEADELLLALREVARAGSLISRFYINELGHAFWRQAGTARFLGALDHGLEFPDHIR